VRGIDTLWLTSNKIKGFNMNGSRNSKRGFKISILLTGIVALGACLRIIAMIFFTGAIDTEGAVYARIAENLFLGKGYVSIATPGLELTFPPGFPFLIAILSFFARDYELAARLVCIIFGSILPIGVYYVTSKLYDRKTSLLAAAAAALHPLLINASASTYSEISYITAVIIGTYFAIRCMEGAKIHWFVSTGAVFGLGYLIRPEGFILPFMTGLFIAIVQWKSGRTAWRGIAAMLVTFFIMAGPYIAFLYHHTGQLRFEGKTPINFELGRRVLAGEDFYEISFGVGPNLEGTGVWMRSNEAVIRSARISFKDKARIALRGSKELAFLTNKLSKGSLGSFLLLFLAILGLFNKPWPRGKIKVQLFLIGLVCSSAAGLLTIIHSESSRFYWIYVPLLLIWASNGAIYLRDWTISTIDAGRKCTSIGKIAGIAVGVLPLVGIFTISLVAVYVYNKAAIEQSRPNKVAGVWLRNFQSGRITIMDSQTNLAFHCGGDFVFIPNGAAETVLAYADRKKVDFIVLRPFHPWIKGRKVIEDWGLNGIKDERAELVYASPGRITEGSIFIYRWKHRDS